MKYKQLYTCPNTNELSSVLKRDYKFPLLNFASIIAEVLDDRTLFSKNVFGMKRRDIRPLLDRIDILHSQAARLSNNAIFRVYPNIANRLNKVASEIEAIGNDFKGLYESMVKHLPLPSHEIRPRPIGKSNQIAILWAVAIKDSQNNIHWQNICALFDWFTKRLENAKYFYDLRIEDVQPLKVLHSRLLARYSHIYKLSQFQYFSVIYGGSPLTYITKPGGPLRLCPITRIRFFNDTIESVILIDGQQIPRKICFKRNGAKQAENRLLLDIC